ncbi:MAG: hypothetical protein AAFS01_05515 [Pseudomonadota bacterium]
MTPEANNDGDAATQKSDHSGAWRDLGWFPKLYAGLVGAPSVLALVQMARADFKLSYLFQWIVDGYNAVMFEISAWIEPFIVPIIEHLNDILGLSLSLGAHWRPIFLVLMMLIIALARPNMRWENKWNALFIVVFGLGGAALSAISFGLLPIDSGWFVQALGAAAVITIIVMCFSLGSALRLALHRNWTAEESLFKTQREEVLNTLKMTLPFAVFLGAVMFMICGAIYAFAGIADGLAILSLAFLIGALGVLMLRGTDDVAIKAGMTIMSGYVLAAGIMGADLLVRVLG